MVPKTNLNLHDYLVQAGIAGPKNQGHSPHQTPEKQDRTTFSAVLAAARTNPGKTEKTDKVGLTLQDYLKQPVEARKYLSKSGTNQKQINAIPSTKAPVNTMSHDAAVASRSEKTNEMRIEKSVRDAAAKYDIPAELIKGVIKAESNFDHRAVSRAGARGLMQLMPATAKELGVRNSFNIEQNIDGGARYLRQMLDRFDNNTQLALAAYNAGPGTVEKFNGNVPYAETRNYVKKVMSYVQV